MRKVKKFLIRKIGLININDGTLLCKNFIVCEKDSKLIYFFLHNNFFHDDYNIKNDLYIEVV